MGDARWRAVLPDATSAAVLDHVVALAGRPRELPRAVRHDLAGGGTGLALVYRHLDLCLPGRGWGATADGWLTAATAGAERVGACAPGLFGGLAGPAFAARTPDRNPDGDGRETPHDRVVADAITRARALGAGGSGLPVREFDVISGLTGIGAYLLRRAAGSDPESAADPTSGAALRAILTALVRLCAEREGTPRWYTPVEAAKDPRVREMFPNGTLNCGMSHGISGPLALLALALDAGVRVEGQREVLTSAARWLTDHRADDAWGPNWAAMVAVPEPPGTPGSARPTSANTRVARASWCYGSPGIARALWLAGSALGDASLCELATRSLKAVYRRPASARLVDDTPGLCHGVAGLLQITLRFAHDTGDPAFVEAAGHLTEHLLRLRAALPAAGPGFLDGAAGAILALLAAATDVPPTWDRALLLS